MSDLQGKSFSMQQSYQMFCICSCLLRYGRHSFLCPPSQGTLMLTFHLMMLYPPAREKATHQDLMIQEPFSVIKKTQQSIVFINSFINSFSKSLCFFLVRAMASDHATQYFAFSYFSLVPSWYPQLFTLHPRACCLLTLIAGFRRSCVDTLHLWLCWVHSDPHVGCCHEEPLTLVLRASFFTTHLVVKLWCLPYFVVLPLPWAHSEAVQVCVAGVSEQVVHLRVCFFTLGCTYDLC